MKCLKKVFTLFLVLCLCGGFSFSAMPKVSKDTAIVKSVGEAYWNYLTEKNLYFRQRAGLKIERLPMHSYNESETGMKKMRGLRDKLLTIDPKNLHFDDKLSFRLLEWQFTNEIRFHEFFWFQCPIAAYSSPIPDTNRFLSNFHIQDTQDMERYLRLLDQYAEFIHQLTAVLTEQYRKKIILPKPALIKIIPYYQSLIQTPVESFLYVKQERIKNKNISTSAKSNFKKQVARIINEKVNPSIMKMLAFVKGNYLKEASPEVGLWQYPGGKDFYRFLVKYFTSFEISPEKVHAIGLQQVELLNKQLDQLRKELKFKGDINAFRQFLKTDKQFTPTSPEAIGKQLMNFKKQAEVQVPRFFKRLPQAPCGVKRLNPSLEASQTYGFYEPPIGAETHGYYHYNASNLEKKNILNSASASLILHELLPGHHMQIMLQAENKGLPAFRREFFLTPYNEGWAEYAAYLGSEMGIYNDPYVKCSGLMQELFMAVRLVVDTGMNYYRWPRQKAMDFMKKYNLQSDLEIRSETLRYSTGIPGQALGYRIGHLKILESRKKAEKELGSQFNIKSFHEAILSKGTLPLFLLEESILHFIQESKMKFKN
jgi:uncharacterized protein (DUF885 family)